MTYCYNCFGEHDGLGPCPRCGYDPAFDQGKFPLALPHGSILAGQYITGRVLGLAGQYITGRVLGQGGFGVTYLALDRTLGVKVAIKEFLPESMAGRSAASPQITAYTGERGEQFRYGLEHFLDEARTLAKFIGNPNIVGVRSYFQENGTAYFVMEYVEGVSLKTYLKNHGGRIEWQEAGKILLPVMDALCAVHREGIIHRDIAPDNIYITGGGTVKLLDFGAARYSLGDRSQSLDVVLKHGYAPKEQYTRRGRQGAYTDVYALAATFYTAITGYVPPDALDRMEEDDLVPPSTRGIRLPAALEDAILQGLEVRAEDRFQTMDAFRKAIGMAMEQAGPQSSQWSQPNPGPQSGQWGQSNSGPQSGQWGQSNPGPQSSQWGQSNSGPQSGQWSQPNPGPQSGQWSQSGPGPQTGPGVQTASAPQPNPTGRFGGRKLLQALTRRRVALIAGVGAVAVIALLIALPSLRTPPERERQEDDSQSDQQEDLAILEGQGGSGEDQELFAGPVTFQDAGFEEIIREMLGKEAGQEIQSEELARITTFSIEEDVSSNEMVCTMTVEEGEEVEKRWSVPKEVSDLSDLVWLTGCTELTISDQVLTDLTPLAELTQLTYLDLQYDNIADITPLANLTGLKSLNLNFNDLTDISALSGLTNLTYLNVSDNDVADLTPLSGLTKVQKMDLSYNEIVDLTPLADLKQLTYLDIMSNDIVNVTPLVRLTQLEYLDLGYNDVTNLKPLAYLTWLTELDLGKNGVTDLSPLAALTRLKELNLNYNADLTDLSPLAGLTGLEKIWLWDCDKIVDYSPVEHVPTIYLR